VRSRIRWAEPLVLGRFLTVLVALTVTTSALAGCGSEDKPKSTPSPTSKPSMPPGLDTTPPPKPEAAETKESAVEYGRYLALLVQHAVRVRSVRPVMAEARDQAKCSSCRGVSEFIEKELRADKVWEVEPDLRLGKFSARRTSYGFEVNGTFEYPPGKYVRIDGSEKDTAPGGSYVFQAFLVWDADGSRWRVDDYTFANKSKG
jgi:hypothetical protein